MNSNNSSSQDRGSFASRFPTRFRFSSRPPAITNQQQVQQQAQIRDSQVPTNAPGGGSNLPPPNDDELKVSVADNPDIPRDPETGAILTKSGRIDRRTKVGRMLPPPPEESVPRARAGIVLPNGEIVTKNFKPDLRFKKYRGLSQEEAMRVWAENIIAAGVGNPNR